jgi:two-component system NtrC family response regulator
MKPKVLIVDDDEAIRTQMKWALSHDYEVHFAEDRRGALEALKANSPAVTLLDLGLPPRPNECDEGLAVLADLLAVDSTAKVIIISGQSEKQNAIQAVGAGAYDFLCKPVEMEELKLLLRRCIHVVELEKEYRELQQSQLSDVFEDMQSLLSSARSPERTLRCSCSEKVALAKKWRQRRFIAAACARTALLSRSTATPFLKTFWRVSSSATKKAPLPVLTFSAKG